MENEETVYDADDTGLVKDLRRQLKDALRQNKQFEDELSTFRTQARISSIGELLESNGVNPKAAKFVPSDLEDDEIVGWLEENRDLFGGMETQKAEAKESPISKEVRQEQVRANELTAAATSPEKIADLEHQMQNAESEDEINNILSEFQSYRL